MKRIQKMAWSIVVGMSTAAILVVVAGVLYVSGVSWWRWLLWAAAFAQGAGGVACFRTKPDPGAVTSDERDQMIEKNANLAGFGGAYLFIIVASFAPIGILGEKATIPVTWMPGLLVGAGLCQAYAFFVAILIQYGRGERGTSHE